MQVQRGGLRAKSTYSCPIETVLDYLHPHGDTPLSLTLVQGDFSFCFTDPDAQYAGKVSSHVKEGVKEGKEAEQWEGQ